MLAYAGQIHRQPQSVQVTSDFIHGTTANRPAPCIHEDDVSASKIQAYAELPCLLLCKWSSCHNVSILPLATVQEEFIYHSVLPLQELSILPRLTSNHYNIVLIF